MTSPLFCTPHIFTAEVHSLLNTATESDADFSSLAEAQGQKRLFQNGNTLNLKMRLRILLE